MARSVRLYLLNVIAETGMTPAQLAAASKCYCFDGQIREAIKVYLLKVAAGMGSRDIGEIADAAACYCYGDRRIQESVIIYILANIAGLQEKTPLELANLAKCYCFDVVTARKVELYLLCIIANDVSCDVNDLAEASTPYVGLTTPIAIAIQIYTEIAIANGGVPPEDQGYLLNSDGGYILNSDGGRIIIT